MSYTLRQRYHGIPIMGAVSLILFILQYNERKICEARFAVRLDYGQYHFWISLHSPFDDQFVSKGIKEKLKYGSVDEMHSVCELSSVQCNSDHLFVEVGSAVGMVSLYAASRGMSVIAFDPLAPNIRRIRESLCVNCARSPSNVCRNFSPERFAVHLNLVGAQSDPVGRIVQSEPGNLAATMRGGGSVRTANVTTVTIDQSVSDREIEVLLLTCQGFEYEALLGASHLLASRKIRNIIWRRHYTLQEHNANALKILQFLWSNGFKIFYNLEGCRNGGTLPVQFLSDEEVMDYVMSRRGPDEHPNILASLY
jgi:FkbM family methyltransferase